MRAKLLLLFTLSGFSGLIYESIWTHYLKLFLGHAAYAQSLVLAIFMGGMALGAWATAGRADRVGDPLRAYALVEAVVGVLALLFHPIFVGATGFAHETLFGVLNGPVAVMTAKWGLAALLILPQSILLGATFPLMSAGLLRRCPERPGSSLALLYFTNSLGGVIGVLASGFLLIGALGLPGTLALAGAINLLLALVVWRLAQAKADRAAVTAPPSVSSDAQGLLPFLLVAALVTGAASFIYEIGWLRLLSLVLGASTHGFELMLAAFILGLALGGLWIRGRIDRLANPLSFLGWVQIAMGMLALATLAFYAQSFDVMAWLMNKLDRTLMGYALFNLSSHGIALAVMLPATFCAGTTLPLITFLLLRAGQGEGAIGRVYGANTVGGIIGVVAAVHIGFPYLGLKGMMAAGAALDMALGVALLARSRGYALAGAGGAAGLAVMAAVLLFVEPHSAKMASGVYRGLGLIVAEKGQVLGRMDGKTATVHLTGKRDQEIAIRTNGKADASISVAPGGRASADESTMILLGALPLLSHPEARLAANIGFGSGLTSHVLLASPGIERLDTIEIEPAMVEMAKIFQPRNRRVYEDPRSRIVFDDAKTHLAAERTRYDVIVSEPSNPWVSGVAGLFSVEFYRLATRHLAPGGLFVQWLQLYETDIGLVTTVLKALGTVFSDYVVYAANEGDLVILASPQGRVPDLKDRRLKEPDLARELDRIGIASVDDVLWHRIGDKALFAPFLAEYPLGANSDFDPVLDQGAVRERFLRRNARDLISSALEPLPVLEMLGLRPPAATPTRVSARDAFAVTRMAAIALSVREAARSLGGDPLQTAAATGLGHEGAAGIRLLEACRKFQEGGDKVYLLYEIALKAAPYLRPDEMASIWAVVESLGCGSRLSPVERMWLDLFKAVSDRDARRMADTAQRLLDAGGPALTPARRKYAVATVMLGELVLGNHQTVSRVWEANRTAIFGDTEPRVLMRLLAAHGRHGPNPDFTAAPRKATP